MKNRVTRSSDAIPVRNILCSVSDKTGLDTFISGLLALSPELRIYTTGGTGTCLRDLLGADSPNIREVSDYTGQPEMQGGLVKTLDFKIYLGLLSEEFNEAHLRDLERSNAVNFDAVVVNLYPFEQTIAVAGADLEDARANIDIGGPCMLRAASKNFLRVAPVSSPGDYSFVLEKLSAGRGSLDLATRLELAKRTFARTAAYDTAIAGYLAKASADALEIYKR